MKSIGKRITVGLAIGIAGVMTAYAAQKVTGDPSKAKPIIAESCQGCHGMDGNGPVPNFPKLAGQNAEYLFRELKGFKAGDRAIDTMQPFCAALSESDMANLALYFAAQKPTPGVVTKPELVAKGKDIYFNGNPDTNVSSCEGCHGEEALGSGKYPRLAGQNVEYTLESFKEYATAVRKNGVKAMQRIAHRLSQDEIEAVAQYLASLK